MIIFFACGYLLSSTFAYAYVESNGEAMYISMTALNLAFGSMGADHPVYMNTAFGIVYIALPLIGFISMFADHHSNVKNLIGIACGVIGCTAIALPIGFNQNLSLGVGAFASMMLYMCATTLSAIAVFMKLEDNRENRSEEDAPKLKKHR